MSLIDEEYSEQIRAMPPFERVERSFAMFQWSREVIERQITAEFGSLPAEKLKWLVALRVYGSNPQARAMIEKLMADVSS